MNKAMSSFEEKPYNLCLNCAHIGKRCDGPNFLAMDIQRMCEWGRLRKDYLHSLDPKWTNAYIAEQAGLSKISVDRFMSGNVTDLKMSTISRIIKVLVNGTWGQYPCAMDAFDKDSAVDNRELVERAEKANAECERLKEALADAKEHDRTNTEYLKEKIKFQEEQMKQKDKLLEERADYLRRKDRWIRTLAIMLTICLVCVLAAVVVDFLNREIGFIWLESIKEIFNENMSNMDLII